MLAPALFALCLLVFGALRPDYSHLTDAVSELGARGAPNALAWNLLGFVTVGLLIPAFSWGPRPARGLRRLPAMDRAARRRSPVRVH